MCYSENVDVSALIVEALCLKGDGNGLNANEEALKGNEEALKGMRMH